MHHPPSTAPERTSIGMGVVAVAVGVGYGVVDSIARHVHRHELDPSPPVLIRTFDAGRTTHAPVRHRVHA